LTAHHSGLAEAEHYAMFGCGFVMQGQWDRVPVRRPLDSRPVLWPLDCRHFVPQISDHRFAQAGAQQPTLAFTRCRSMWYDPAGPPARKDPE
jgi:hypothetical protein